MIEPTKASILIANPHLNDPDFTRSVIFLCETNPTGIGFLLNKKSIYTVNELVPDIILNHIPVYEGGPVAADTLHFIHQHPYEIKGGKEILDGVFWGGNLGNLIDFINSGGFNNKTIRFFHGYSGWSEGQLTLELEEKSWIVAEGKKEFIFHDNDVELWKTVLKQLGGEYTFFINAPLDPRSN